MSRRFQLLPCAALLSCLLACGGGGGGGSTVAPPAAADFSLQVTPANLQIPAGGSGFLTITLSRLNGFSSAVAITGAGFPAGVVASGTVPAGATSLQLPVVVAPEVAPSVYAGLSLRAQAGTLTHDAPLGLTVAQALAPGHLRDDLVQAAGGRQTGGTFENQAVVREGFPAQTVKDANDSTRVRHGFHPSGAPTDR
ncbi:MAG: hypothetical protein NDI58_02870 [Geothrix sp.]|nr:hypothetical protein [Geothrix sp.]